MNGQERNPESKPVMSKPLREYFTPTERRYAEVIFNEASRENPIPTARLVQSVYIGEFYDLEKGRDLWHTLRPRIRQKLHVYSFDIVTLRIPRQFSVAYYVDFWPPADSVSPIDTVISPKSDLPPGEKVNLILSLLK